MADSTSLILKDLHFVVSKTEDRSVLKVIKNNGGKLQNSLTKGTDFFIQGYNTEDDDRLGEAGDKDIRVVSPEFIKACINAGAILDISEHAFGDRFENDDFPESMCNSKMANEFFKAPSYECREREELPQSFNEFLSMERYTPAANKRTICLLPLFDMDATKSSRKRSVSGKKKLNNPAKQTGDQKSKEILLKTLRTFLEIFFCLPVEVLPPCPLQFEKKREAKFKFGKYLYSVKVHGSRMRPRVDAMEIIGCLEDCLPAHGFCILGITDEDICEDPSDQEPLLGRATGDRAGLLSIWYHCRSSIRQPQATDDGCSTSEDRRLEYPTTTSKTIPLRAMLNTAAHETMHMFGLDHCAYYACVMNSWSDPSVDPLKQPEKVSPLHLCPIDLRKLHSSCEFDVIKRYQKLLEFYTKSGINDEMTWIEEILEHIIINDV